MRFGHVPFQWPQGDSAVRACAGPHHVLGPAPRAEAPRRFIQRFRGKFELTRTNAGPNIAQTTRMKQPLMVVYWGFTSVGSTMKFSVGTCDAIEDVPSSGPGNA